MVAVPLLHLQGSKREAILFRARISRVHNVSAGLKVHHLNSRVVVVRDVKEKPNLVNELELLHLCALPLALPLLDRESLPVGDEVHEPFLRLENSLLIVTADLKQRVGGRVVNTQFFRDEDIELRSCHPAIRLEHDVFLVQKVDPHCDLGAALQCLELHLGWDLPARAEIKNSRNTLQGVFCVLWNEVAVVIQFPRAKLRKRYLEP
mmetsp:Transcript_3187/g.6443  ORF Transcript_3187/g.6443 Transcript_3187/m.6443 type:complete len:206 (-) Transcript_3187:1034-1651(-)